MLFLASIGCNFGLGLLMSDPKQRRFLGMIGVALNLAALCYFKYAGFLLDSVSALSGMPMPLTNIILPLGISFFTFQQIAYLVDVMRGAKVERDIVSYTLFVSFFPHLIAGPLVHHAEMIPQFKRAGDVRTASMAARGVAIFVAGLFKKVVIADNLAQFVSPVFAHADAGGGVAMAWAWLATLSYTLQIYFDFSGYSDMALGLGLLFGIRLPVNFRSPYRATSIIEFWRRWHITLSRFLRDYLYIPLGGNRLSETRRYINLLVTMLLGGLWHGAGWNFVVWGGLHGLYLCINHVWRSSHEATLGGTPASVNFLASIAGWAVTFVAAVIAWVFFRAGTMTGAWQILRSLLGQADLTQTYMSTGVLRVMDLPILLGADKLLFVGSVILAVAMVVAVAAPNVPQIFGYREYRRAPEPRTFVRWRPNFGWALLVAIAFTMALFGMWQRLEFLYFQF
ncbi:MAG: MBOAT family protein [Pseudomonadota bacterium]